MVGLNQVTVRFIKATDYLKDTKGIKHGDICDFLGLKRWQYDQIRIGRRNPTPELINILTKKYTEIEKFFDDQYYEETLTPREGENESDLIKSLNQLIKAKDEIIKMKDAKIKDLELDLVAVHLAHEQTLKSLYTEEEAIKIYAEKLKELEALQKMEKK